MKLSSLYENDLSKKLLQALSGAWFKKQQDPMNPEALRGKRWLPYRSGTQDTPLKSRHRKYFNSPASGKSDKPGFADNKPLGSWPPAHKPTPSGQASWGKRPGVKDI